ALRDVVPAGASVGFLSSLLALLVVTGQFFLSPQSFGSAPPLAVLFGVVALPFAVFEAICGPLLVAGDDLGGFNRSLVTGRLLGFILSLTAVLALEHRELAVVGAIAGQSIGIAASAVLV